MDELLVWRTLAVHPDLSESVRGLTAVLARDIPVLGLVVLRLDLPQRQTRVVAMDWTDQPTYAIPPRLRLVDGQVERILAWHRSGEARRGRPGQDDVLHALWPAQESHDIWVAPLGREGDGPAVLLLFIREGPMSPEQERSLSQIVEPLAVALDNHHRLHELKRLNEAAEADKRGLLERLDRQELAGVIIGAETGLAEVMQKVRLVGPTETPVLILGETGSGKEVIARAIHACSPRHGGPMVRVNCGAIPPGLVDSELFGHERGGFTGAVATRHGWFERADGGTLFLDEIGELTLDAQVRLLRVLQDMTIERVGGTEAISVDVRVVAATHCALDDLVRVGRFRRDLWYRLSVFPLHLPPLRAREQDIPSLAAHFAAQVGRRLHGWPLVPSPEDVEALLSYDWPGNVRELAAVIERAAILGDGRALHVGAALGKSPIGIPRDAAVTAEPPGFAQLGDVIRDHIEKALRRSRGQVEGRAGAAALLGVNPHTLRARMRTLGIKWERFRTSSRSA
jgi:hydrogenase-4 transcriptional activator